MLIIFWFINKESCLHKRSNVAFIKRQTIIEHLPWLRLYFNFRMQYYIKFICAYIQIGKKYEKMSKNLF